MTRPNDREDSELRQWFAELRSADSTKLPPYRRVIEHALGRRRFTTPRRSLIVRAAAAALLITGGVLAYQRLNHRAPRQSTHVVSPVASWKSPTAILLRTSGSELLSEIPDLDASILDRFTPTIKSEEPGS